LLMAFFVSTIPLIGACYVAIHAGRYMGRYIFDI